MQHNAEVGPPTADYETVKITIMLISLKTIPFTKNCCITGQILDIRLNIIYKRAGSDMGADHI